MPLEFARRYRPEAVALALGENQIIDFLFDRYANRLAAEPRIESARNRQHTVADDLAFEALAVHTPVKLVVGIGLGLYWIVRRRLPVGVREHDHAVDRFDTPVVLHEFDGQPVEQLLVRRSLPQDAEIIRSSYNSRGHAELPDAIDHDASRERMFRR